MAETDVHTVPPAGSPYTQLPSPLLDTLIRSFAAKQDKIPGQAWTLANGDILSPEDETSWNLGNAFFGGGYPKTLWEALDTCGPQWLNQLVCIYSRIQRIDPTLTLWKQIKYIRNGWWGGSGGIKVVYEDPVRMRELLKSLLQNSNGPRIAKDIYWGGLDHQLKPSWENALEGLKEFFTGKGAPEKLPDSDTFREIDRPNEEALHFCIGKFDLRDDPNEGVGPDTLALKARHLDLDDIHLDWKSPAEGIDGEHCDYGNPVNVTLHWMQATQGIGVPTFCFEEISRHIAKAERYMSAYSYPIELTDELKQFKQMWQVRGMHLAAQGRSGRSLVIPLHRHLEQLVQRICEGHDEPKESATSLD